MNTAEKQDPIEKLKYEAIDKECCQCPLGNKVCPVFILRRHFTHYRDSEKGKALKLALDILQDENGKCLMRTFLTEEHG